jgi:hypothetical protein
MITLKDELSRVELGAPTRFRNLTVYPLLRPAPAQEEPDYHLLEQAIELGLARVTEVSAGGSVPELRFENRSDRPVLLLDGEELVGAKQNRVLNLTILVAAGHTAAIPVSCVEAGRWHMENPEFRTAQHVMFSRARAQRTSQVTESMRSGGSRCSNQGEVWDEIASLAHRMDAPSPTGAMNAIYEKHSLSLDQYLAAFAWQPRQAGILFTIGSKTCGLDLLDHESSMRRLYPKLIRSYALDALDAATSASDARGAADPSAFLHRIAAAPAFTQPSLGMGKDLRLAAAGISGAGLWAEARYVHLCAFSVNGSGAGHKPHTRMSRPSGRRVF